MGLIKKDIGVYHTVVPLALAINQLQNFSSL